MDKSPFDLSGKVAVVTGGNGGIGLGIAQGLGVSGADIAIAARNESKTQKAIDHLNGKGVNAIGVSTDVSEEDSVGEMVRETVRHYGHIDILVNNSGINIRKLPHEYSVVEWEEVMNVNLKGTFLCSREVYPHMVESGGGKIINIGSMTSIFGGDVLSVYSATKGGVVQLTKSSAIAWAKDNIQVNTILPGWISTALTDGLKATFPEKITEVTKRIPSGRWGVPGDLAGTAIFLASGASDYVTGSTVTVDGGYSSF